jgi:hypothetical protein
MEFEVPFRELGFHGVPHRSTAFVMPTVNCLVRSWQHSRPGCMASVAAGAVSSQSAWPLVPRADRHHGCWWRALSVSLSRSESYLAHPLLPVARTDKCAALHGNRWS